MREQALELDELLCSQTFNDGLRLLAGANSSHQIGGLVVSRQSDSLVVHTEIQRLAKTEKSPGINATERVLGGLMMDGDGHPSTNIVMAIVSRPGEASPNPTDDDKELLHKWEQSSPGIIGGLMTTKEVTPNPDDHPGWTFLAHTLGLYRPYFDRSVRLHYTSKVKGVQRITEGPLKRLFQ